MICRNSNSPIVRLFKFAPALLIFASVSACTTGSVSDGLRPTATVGAQPAPTQIQPQQAPDNSLALASPEQQVPDFGANLPPSPGVTFLPVIGPPQSAISRLSSSIRNSAKNNGVTIIPNGQTGAEYQVKGYFSALDDGTGTRLIFIWDVLDRNGRNIHRISGEERTGTQNANPWSAITPGMITNIVERTMQNLYGWLNTRA